MGEEDVTRMIVIFDNYIKKIENPRTVENLTDENAKRLMEFCRFVETTVARAFAEDKAECLENYLRAHWSKEQHRTKFYTMSQLGIACDGMLEVFLKDPEVSTLSVDKFLQYYTRYCGVERLNIALGSMIEDAMSTSVIMESLIDLGISEDVIEDEIILEAWKNEAACGKQEQVSACIVKMIDDGEIGKLIIYAAKLDDDSVVKKLIMQRLTLLASEYQPSFFALLADIETKILLRLLRDGDFRISFVDGIFFFARNMKYQSDSWHSENEFDYQRLVRTIRKLFKGSDELRDFVSEGLELAKVSSDSSVWTAIERDSMS